MRGGALGKSGKQGFENAKIWIPVIYNVVSDSQGSWNQVYYI